MYLRFKTEINSAIIFTTGSMRNICIFPNETVEWVYSNTVYIIECHQNFSLVQKTNCTHIYMNVRESGTWLFFRVPTCGSMITKIRGLGTRISIGLGSLYLIKSALSTLEKNHQRETVYRKIDVTCLFFVVSPFGGNSFLCHINHRVEIIVASRDAT